MLDYLNHTYNPNNHEFVSSLDEAPTWSVPFGMKLLERVRYKHRIKALDIACGTGYPLLELAENLGNSCKVFGVDTWDEALVRAETKLKARKIPNVELLRANAEELPFESSFFSLVVSNNGLNNMTYPEIALSEINRVLKQSGQVILTMNLPGTMHEFYDVFKTVLKNHGLSESVAATENHILEKRKPLITWLKLIRSNGFETTEVSEDRFRYHFCDASAMFNHSFIKLAFLEPWKELVPDNMRETVFSETEDILNKVSSGKGMILTIPFACIDCKKT